MLFPPETMGIEPGAWGAPTVGPHVTEEAFRWALSYVTSLPAGLSGGETSCPHQALPTYRSVTIQKKKKKKAIVLNH